MASGAEASMRDVADRAGVSTSTVSRALRGSALVKPETAERILAAADELSFAVSRAASGLASGRLGRIAVLVSGPLHAWFNGSILDAIYQRLNEADQELLIYRISDIAERDRFFARMPARRNADALVLASFSLTPAERARLDDLAMPVVYLNQRVRGAVSVSIDDAAGAAQGTRYLLNLGHRRIAFVGSRNLTGFSFSSSGRRSGFLDAMSEYEVAPEPDLLADRADRGDQVVADLLARPRVPSALMVESDEQAMSVLSALSGTGRRVPDDVSVLGFDDHQMAGPFGLSTVAQPVADLGRVAADMALALAAGEPVRRRQVTLPTTLMLRRSTRAPT